MSCALGRATGGLAAAGDLLLDRLRAGHERHTLPRSANLPPGTGPRFVVGRFLSNDALLGAVGLVLRRYGWIR